VLIVVHNGYAAAVDKPVFYLKTLGGFDVLEIDTAETRCERANYLHHSPRVFFIDFEVDSINTGEYFEQQGLSFNYGLCGLRADVAQAKYGGAV